MSAGKTQAAAAHPHYVTFDTWAVAIGISSDSLSAGEIRKMGRRLLDMGATVVRHAREHGVTADDVPETHDIALTAAEFLLGMAGAFGDEADAMDLAEDKGNPEPRGRQLAGTF